MMISGNCSKGDRDVRPLHESGGSRLADPQGKNKKRTRSGRCPFRALKRLPEGRLRRQASCGRNQRASLPPEHLAKDPG